MKVGETQSLGGHLLCSHVLTSKPQGIDQVNILCCFQLRVVFVHTVGFNPTNPPYGIRNQGGSAPLNTKTLDMDCVHFGNVLEYNAHNLFGRFLLCVLD